MRSVRRPYRHPGRAERCRRCVHRAMEWSISRNDDVRNGAALCKLCHWVFDLEMMSVSDSFTVLLSRNLPNDANAAGLLGVLEGRNAVGPKDREVGPQSKNLAWRRNQHGF